jgi:MFS family permease
LSSLSVLTNLGGQVGILVVGYVIGSSLGSNVPDVLFVIAAGLTVAGILTTVLFVREPGREAWGTECQPEAAVVGDSFTWRTLVHRYPGAVTLSLIVFCYWFGSNTLSHIVSYINYPLNVNGDLEPPDELWLLGSAALLSTSIMALLMGYLGPRIGKRRVLGLAFTIVAVSAAMGLVITTVQQAAMLFLMIGIGNAACLVLTIPLLADLVPRHHMGAATGLLAAAGAIAAPLSGLVARSLADSVGPRAIFLVTFVAVIIALGFLTRLRVPVITPAQHTSPAP